MKKLFLKWTNRKSKKREKIIRHVLDTIPEPEGEKLPYQGLTCDQITEKHPNEHIKTEDFDGFSILELRGNNFTICCTMDNGICQKAVKFFD